MLIVATQDGALCIECTAGPAWTDADVRKQRRTGWTLAKPDAPSSVRREFPRGWAGQQGQAISLGDSKISAPDSQGAPPWDSNPDVVWISV
jgi:hypothetical protein